MTYLRNDSEMTYNEYLCKTAELVDIIQESEELLEHYFNLLSRIRTWNPFFNPKITITEVNNDNMGHIYLGKIRVPMNFSKMDVNGKLEAKVLTFVVCKYDDLPGEKHSEERANLAFQKAISRLRKVFEERFSDGYPLEEGCTKGDDLVAITAKLDRIDVFLGKLGFPKIQ